MTVAHDSGLREVAEYRREAVERSVQDRLNRIDEMRAAAQLAGTGLSQRDIAEILHTTQPRVHRMLRWFEESRGAVSPEELILRATQAKSSRSALVRRLSGLKYSFASHAPYPFEGGTSGSWSQVRSAFRMGLLSEGEYERIRSAVRPPPSA